MKISELHSGDLLYWRGTGFKAALVRWWTRPSFWKMSGAAPFSHVGIYWLNGRSPYIVEADSKFGVVARPMTYDLPDSVQKTSVAWTNELQSKVLSLIGRPYSFWTDVATVFCIAGRGSKSFMCSELATRVLTMAGWNWKGYQPTPIGVALGVKEATGLGPELLEL